MKNNEILNDLSKEEKDRIFMDFPSKIEINNKTIEKTVELERQNKGTGNFRIDKGMFRTDEETEEYLKKSLNRDLP